MKIITSIFLVISSIFAIFGFGAGLWEFFIPGAFGIIIFTITFLAVSYRQPKNYGQDY